MAETGKPHSRSSSRRRDGSGARPDASSNIAETMRPAWEKAAPTSTLRIGERVRELRGARALSLDALATQERRQPFDDLAHRARREQPDGRGARQARRGARRDAGLAVRRADRRGAARGAARWSRRDEQPEWRDPASGYRSAQRLAAGRAAADADRRGALPAARRASPSRTAGATCACTSRCGCSTARSTSRSARSAIGCAKATASPCSSTVRRCSTTRREEPRATPW